MTPEQALEIAIEQNPDQAVLLMVKVMFKETAEIKATVDAIVPVLGAIAGKVGLSGKQLRDMIDKASADNDYSVK